MNFTNLDDYSELRPLMIFARNARRRQVTERSERTVEEAEFHRNWQGDDVRPFFSDGIRNKYCCVMTIWSFLFFPAFAVASPVNGYVLGASGNIHEVLSVVMSVRVNDTISRETESGNDVPPEVYPETVRGVSMALNGMINLSEYSRYNGRSWANIFLRSHNLSASFFDSPDVSFTWSRQSCQGALKWVVSGYPQFNTSVKNPVAEIKGVCKQQPYNATPGAYYSARSGNVYSMPYDGGYINGYTFDDVINYFNEVYRSAVYRRYEENFKDFVNRYPLCSSFSLDIKDEDEIKPSGENRPYNINGSSVSLMSSYKVKLISPVTESCILDGRPVKTKGGYYPLADTTIFVSASGYEEGKVNSYIPDIFNGGDKLLLNSYMSAMTRKIIPALAFASVLNTAWAEASASPDYKGIPYSETSRITESDVMSVMNNRNVNPSAADAYAQIPEQGVYLMYWSDTHNSYVTQEVFDASKKVEVDLGHNPGIESPELVQGELSDALNPLFNIMPFLKNFRLDAHAASCPVWTYQVFGQEIPMTSFCTLVEDNRVLISLFFIIQWTIISLVIIVRT
ncbi:hypothetical protein H9043_001086 [Salmonella enterica]|nr:hypothetical protein [Salmonella enterica]ECK7212485.1 hypothetical protein [Salmonella enterica subsp. enterica serovar Guinea]EHG6517180.1 hypothetical protein [Salmonella enterica subsp. enterica serovar 44:z10:1,7]EAT7734798.1 hypothetical protein [Salmonella enterica]EAT8321433.1 hypothetical protein [Salmonella enterica]